MTKEEILAMKMGRELDSLVAIQVFGPSSEDFFLIAQAEGPHTYDVDGFTVEWRPSTNISAAWEVIDKFKVHQVTKNESGFSHSPLKYRAILGKNQNAAYADTAPEAICKAALLAVMEGKDEGE